MRAWASMCARPRSCRWVGASGGEAPRGRGQAGWGCRWLRAASRGCRRPRAQWRVRCRFGCAAPRPAPSTQELLMGSLKDANDFGSEIIPGAKDQGLKVQVRHRGRGGAGRGGGHEPALRRGWVLNAPDMSHMWLQAPERSRRAGFINAGCKPSSLARRRQDRGLGGAEAVHSRGGYAGSGMRVDSPPQPASSLHPGAKRSGRAAAALSSGYPSLSWSCHPAPATLQPKGISHPLTSAQAFCLPCPLL